MTTEWANLPNAAHIDRVIASAKANPDHWKGSWSAQDETWNAPRAEAWNAARGMVLVQVRNAAWDAARDPIRWKTEWDAAWYFAQYAILALVAYDDCAYMLDSDPGELAILAAFGDPRAILLFGACKALQSIKEVV